MRAATHELMRAFGLTTVFGNPGSTELRFFKDWPEDFRYVLGLQESSVVAMADGYAQATGNAAFVNLHSAVGVGHAMGSIFTAMRNQAPLVIIAGQQTRAMLPTEPYLYSQQPTELPQPYVKWSCEPARPSDVPAAIGRAYHVSMLRPRGPTFVSIPEDDWDASGSTQALAVVPRQVFGGFVADAAALGAVASALDRSRSPALVVGPGVDRDGAWEQAVQLAERTRATVWASPLSSRAGFPEDHPLFGGFLTPDRSKLRRQLEGHDVVVVLGAPVFTYHVHSEGPFVGAGTELFQLVDDPQAAAMAPVGTAVLTTLRAGLEQLMALVRPDGRAGGVAGATGGLGRVGRAESAGSAGSAESTGSAAAAVWAGAAGSPRRPPVPVPLASDPISAEFVMHTIGRLMPRDAVVVEEAPTHRNAMHDHLPIRSSGGFYVGASGGLGYGLPAAVGVALGSPGRRVICLLGDGSSLYSIQALWTAAQHRLTISFIVLNNSGYAALKAFGRVMGMDRPPGVDLPGIGLPEIAAGFGCPAHRVDKAEEFAPALTSSLAAATPTLLDVCVDAPIESLY